MGDLLKQNEELEALSSIYGTDWMFEGETSTSRSFKARIQEGCHFCLIYVNLPLDYPSASPPEYQISAPSLQRHEKQALKIALDGVYLENIGESVLYQFVEKIREFVLSINTASARKSNKSKRTNKSDTNKDLRISNGRIEFSHGDLIKDRKSTFQGHATKIHSQEDVRNAVDNLLENRKIAQAKHNIYAYRYKCPKRGVIIQDFNDDGESHAGGRLLHLLNILNAVDVVVIVTRWYGGIHLGPDRFRHINNAGRNALEVGGFI